MKKIFISILLIIVTLPVISSAEFKTVMKALTVEGAARSVAMGDAFTAVTGESFSSAYNPAATIGLRKVKTTLGYNTHWENTRTEIAYISLYKKGVVTTVGIKHWANDSLPFRTGLTEDLVEGSAHDASAKIGVSFELDSSTVIGFNIGIFYEKIDVYDGTAVNFDLGLITKVIDNLKFGAAVLNYGSALSLRDESFDLPTTYRAGLAYNYNEIIASADVVYLDDDMQINAGGEYIITENFAVRAGYRMGYDSFNFSAGVGFTRRNLRIDYAFLPYSEDLNNSHIFNLTFEI